MFKQAIKNYSPKNTQEATDKQVILDFIDKHDDCLKRTNRIAHLTASAIVIDETATHVLFAYHNIYDSWAWVGGHADGNPDLLDVAIKETQEETGLKSVSPVDSSIFMLDTLQVQNHIKHGEYVPDHLHLNATYLLQARSDQPLTIKPDENSGVRWFRFEDALNHVNEPRMRPVYQKTFNHINQIIK